MFKQFFQGKKCPHCDCEFVFCHLCDELAIVEGWYGSGLIKFVPMCEEHQKLLRGYNGSDTS